MVMIILLVIGCLLGIIILAGLAVGIIIIMQSNRQDAVSTARQGWIGRRSEEDEEGW